MSVMDNNQKYPPKFNIYLLFLVRFQCSGEDILITKQCSVIINVFSIQNISYTVVRTCQIDWLCCMVHALLLQPLQIGLQIKTSANRKVRCFTEISAGKTLALESSPKSYIVVN